jgi:fructose-specific phosphotransferase system IIC component
MRRSTFRDFLTGGPVEVPWFVNLVTGTNGYMLGCLIGLVILLAVGVPPEKVALTFVGAVLTGIVFDYWLNR